MVKNISGSNANEPLKNLGNKELSKLQKTEVAESSVLSQLASSIKTESTINVSDSQSLLTSSVQQTSSVTNNPSDTEIAENEYKIYQSLYQRAVYSSIISSFDSKLPRPDEINSDYFQKNPDFLKNLISNLSNTSPCIWDDDKNMYIPINRGSANLDFDLSNLGLTTIPPGLFNDIDNNIKINLSNNNLTSIPEDFLNGCPNVYRLDLSNNNLTTFPDDFLNNCCTREDLDAFFDFSNNLVNTSSSFFFVKSLFFNLSFGCFVLL